MPFDYHASMPSYAELARPDVIAWLLEGDPAVQWQVRSHLLDEDEHAVDYDRARVATEGWGARYLALQGEDGGWNCRRHRGATQASFHTTTSALATRWNSCWADATARAAGPSTAGRAARRSSRSNQPANRAA